MIYVGFHPLLLYHKTPVYEPGVRHPGSHAVSEPDVRLSGSLFGSCDVSILLSAS